MVASWLVVSDAVDIVDIVVVSLLLPFCFLILSERVDS